MFIRQLKYLVTLAELKHFSRAAEACHVSQPALSSAIHNLEKELDLNLVLRGRNFEGLTAEGERVVHWAEHMLASYESMRQEAISAHTNLSGTLRIGAIPTAMPVVPFLTAPCQEKFSGIQVTVLSLSSDEIARRLDHCDLDIGLTFLDEKSLAGFQMYPLYLERYVLAARAETIAQGKPSITWQEVAKLPLCLLTQHAKSTHYRFRIPACRCNASHPSRNRFHFCPLRLFALQRFVHDCSAQRFEPDRNASGNLHCSDLPATFARNRVNRAQTRPLSPDHRCSAGNGVANTTTGTF